MKYNEIKGNLIKLAKSGQFDVIAHGCNCFCRMKRGIAPQMASAFGCDYFPMEKPSSRGDINKLGQIDYKIKYVTNENDTKELIVVNCYTQYQWSTETKPFDYIAFKLCMRKMNHLFKNKHIGLPKIGSHLAGGNWDLIKSIIQEELTDCIVTIVIYDEEHMGI
jgi:O-acetyl-ADP-ribose deacetylase (regulator of RNase III)